MNTPPTAAPSPLLAVTADAPGIHLAASGPDQPGCHPDQLPPTTLCGAHPHHHAGVGAGEIDCPRCLERSPQFMPLPGWSPWR